MGRFVLGVSGASGIILAKRALDALLALGHEVDFVMTNSALYTASLELGSAYAKAAHFTHKHPAVRVHAIQDMGCKIASGSYPTDGMMIIPCSMATVAAVSMGLADNVLRRAADVTLKEKRPLAIVFREAPLSAIHLENMLKLTRVGATIIPPTPAWYLKPQSLEDVENFIVGKAFDALGIAHELYREWEGVR